MSSRGDQRGAALVVTLVLLVVALMLGLSSFQSARLEESMAGNQRASVQALLAAEYGASKAWLEFDPSSLSSEEGVLVSDDRDNVYYSWSVTPDGYGKYLFNSVGEVMAGSDLISQRVISYLGILSIGPGGTIVAANNDDDCEEGSVEFVPPSSNMEVTGEEEVNGNIKAAVQVGCGIIAENIASSIIPKNGEFDDYVMHDTGDDTYTCLDGGGNNRLCNYYGGIQGGIDLDILKNADMLAQFVYGIRDNYSESIVNSIPSSVPEGSITYVKSADDADGNRETFSRSGNFTGSGILIVDGNVDFGGVPGFEGLVIVLGDYVVSGGGGGEFKGSVVSAPIVDSACWDAGAATGCEFDDKKIEIGGGGSSSYSYDPLAILNAFELIDGSGLDELWGVDNQTLKGNFYMASWSELIGNY
ncbi:PilX N-terminal domain-containing pilus assembly protein [Halomonas urumqiensis]|nr:PilX N-terminal domain-containing pilus assembly protein [Halomonas urumqiensis]